MGISSIAAESRGRQTCVGADDGDQHDQTVCDAAVSPPLINPPCRKDRELSDRRQSPKIDSRRFVSTGLVEAEQYEREVWMHEFRNALGNIIAAAGAAKSLIKERRENEVSTAMVHIEQGCNRCLRLFRTMPPF